MGTTYRRFGPPRKVWATKLLDGKMIVSDGPDNEEKIVLSKHDGAFWKDNDGNMYGFYEGPGSGLSGWTWMFRVIENNEENIGTSSIN